MKPEEDNLLTRKTDPHAYDGIEDLSYGPSGGRTKQWLAGFILALIPIVYGIYCLNRGQTTLFGHKGSDLDLTGEAGKYLAIAYISIGGFIHFHFFWGLSERLWVFSQALKIVALLVFIPTIFYSLYLAIV